MLEGQTQVLGGPGFRVAVCSKEEWLMPLWLVFCFLGCRKSPLWIWSHRQRRGNLPSSYAISLRLLRAAENLGSIFARLLCTRENFIIMNQIVSNYGQLIFISSTNASWYVDVRISWVQGLNFENDIEKETYITNGDCQNRFAWWLFMFCWNIAVEKLHITIRKPVVFVADSVLVKSTFSQGWYLCRVH